MRRPTASSLLPAILVALAFFQTAVGLAAPLANGKAKFLGCAYSTPQATNFATYFNQVTPENGGKWGSVEATRGVMNWTELDAAYNFAKSNGFKYRHHILVWGSQQPDWISTLSTADKRTEIEQWFAAVAARCPDLDYIEVVNEPLHAPPNGATIAFSTTVAANYSDALGGTGASGGEWILQSFRLARQHFPGKKLVLNEYGLLNDSANMARYVQIINLLKAENLVDVVSVQAHSFETKDYPTATLAANLDTLAATGLPIMITEMDIDDTTAKPQLADYQRIFPLLWEHPSVVGITLWGYRPGLWRSDAKLVEADGTEKPAMAWLKSYVANNLPVVTAGQTLTVPAAATNGTLVGLVQATDADAGTSLQDWSIVGGTAVGAFTINASSGALSLSNASSLNFASTPTYTLLVKVGDGIGHSVPATVDIVASALPVFGTQPAAKTATPGSAVTFTAAATGAASSGTINYQWQYSADGTTYADLGGANAATYSIASVSYSSAGYYRVVATNSAGSTNSTAARLEVSVAGAAVQPDGYGASSIGGAGTGSQALNVTTAADLRAAATATGPRVITVVGTLDIGTLDITSQKTIQGADANAAVVGTLRVGNGVTNVVVRGLTLSSASGDALVITGGSNVFVTRCTFLDSADHQLRITDGADLVTVSWCEFAASSASLAQRYSVLVGTAGVETKVLRVTLHHNWWTSNLDQRLPLATYGQVHMFNNLIAATGNTSGTVADNQTQLFSERNAYEGVKNPLTKQQTNTALAAARVLTIGNVYTACTGTAPDGGTDSVFTPTYSYSLRAAADVATLVATEAGNNAGVAYNETSHGTASITGPSAAVKPSATLTLNAAVSGLTATGYQWRLNNTTLSGKTAATLTATMDSTFAGTYTVVVSQASGDDVVSTPFAVTLGTADTPPSGGTGGTTGGNTSDGSSGGGGGALGLGFAAVLFALASSRRLFGTRG